MVKYSFIGIVIGLLVFIMPVHASESSFANKGTNPRIIIMGLDDTGSYTLWDPAKQIAEQIVKQMAPRDIFYLRRITDQSYPDPKNVVFRLELPSLQTSKKINPFDRRAKKIRKLKILNQLQLKQQALEKIQDLEPTGSPRTDVQGFLTVATEKFAMYGHGRRRFLIIASDLQDNVRYTSQLNFSDTQIVIAGFQPDPNPQIAQQFMKGWSDFLGRCGAIQTKFIRSDEKIVLKDY